MGRPVAAWKAAGKKWGPKGHETGHPTNTRANLQGPFERGRVLRSAVPGREGPAPQRSGAHGADPPAAVAGGCSACEPARHVSTPCCCGAHPVAPPAPRCLLRPHRGLFSVQPM